MHNDFSARPGAAVVVGATGGIGAALARLLRDRGRAGGVTYRGNAAAADALVAEGAARAWQLDLTDADACARVLIEIVGAYGSIHTLVYAAGPHGPMVPLSRVTP